MKKIAIVLFALASIASSALSQSVDISFENGGNQQIWDSVKEAIKARELTVTEFKPSDGVLKTSYFQWKSLLVNNRAQYKIKLKGSDLSIELINRQYESTNGWSDSFLELSKPSYEKYLVSLKNEIESSYKRRASHTTSSKSIAPSENPGNISNSNLSKTEKKSDLQVEQNGLSVSISSIRYIGNLLFVSGKVKMDRVQVLNYHNEPVITTPDGESFSVKRTFWSGKEKNLAAGYDYEFQPDLSISFDYIFDLRGQKITTIAKLCIPAGHEGRYDETYETKFYNLNIPLYPDPFLNAHSFEIYKNVYLKWKKQESTNSHLKLFFTIENKSGKEVVLDCQDCKVIDDAGVEHSDYDLYIGGKIHHFDPVISPDIPISGVFDFKESIPFTSVRMFLLFTDLTQYAIKEITFPQ